jgi:uncharacterized repeat protein (TIGR03803 family)
LAAQGRWDKLAGVSKTDEVRLPMARRCGDRGLRSLCFGFLVVVGASLLSWAVEPALAAEAQALHGSVPEAVARLAPVGRLPASKHLDVVIGLPLRNRERLGVLLQGIYKPGSANYRHYLTPQQFTEQFGPAEADYQAVIAFANSHGLKVTGTHANRTLVDVNGTVAEIEKTFHVNLRTYPHPAEGRTFFAPDAELSLDLAVPVLAISGLDDFVLPRPMGLNSNFFKKRMEATPLAAGSGPIGYFLGKDFRAAYAPGVALDGSGQSVGLFELDGYNASDITDYENLAGLPNVILTNVLLDGISGKAGGNQIEVDLDIEMAVAMAPGLSRVIVYEGKTGNDVLNRMATDDLAGQLSSSWSFGSQVDAAREQIFQQFAAQGQSFFQASGDLGAAGGPIPPPSDDPWITVVGGTSLTTSGPGGAWSSETTWPHSTGGISTSYPIPIWQQGVGMSGNLGSSTMRNVPDVACLADVVIWVVVNHGEQGVVGGTSAAAPLWAGFAALANQQAAANGSPGPGFLNPALYAIGQGPGYAAAFHDITTGNNTNSASVNKFLSVPGYDLCTGWGTPAGSDLIAALLAPPDALNISPGGVFTFDGPAGGPFHPAAQTWSLTNTGTASLGWTVSNTPSWLNVTPAGGTLSAGGPAAVLTATPASAAGSLAAGSHTALLLFTNLEDGFGQSRQVTLSVDAPPLITAQPNSVAAPAGATATFAVGTAANGSLLYQWQQDNGMYLTNLADGGNVSGSATSVLTVSNVSPANVGVYCVMVSNSAGVTVSSNATLTILPFRPVIVAQPAGQTALPGQTIVLTVAAVGNQPLSYQWQESGTNLSDAGNLSGSASTSLTFQNTTGANAGTYWVIVSNSFGTAASSAAVLSVTPATAAGAAMTTLYSFTGGNDGGNPNGLVQGADGFFYGTTRHGGSNSWGSVFRMAPGGPPASLYAFSGGNDGATPFSALAQGVDGNFYGTTVMGGSNENGTVFRMTPGGALAALATFNITNGNLPYGGLILGADAALHGTCDQGGAGSFGTVYQVSTNGALAILHSFSEGSDGGQPVAGLLMGGDGNFYGTTFAGGAYGYGTVFRISTNGTLTTLVSLGYTNGAYPRGGLAQDADGNFYGATSQGGDYTNGTVFKMTSAGLVTNLYSFTGGEDGGQPAAGLLYGSDGDFYGTTAYGGHYGDGTLFTIAPGGMFRTLVQFEGFNGANPQAQLAESTGGILYGTTPNGGANNRGAIFSLAIASAPEITAPPASRAVFVGQNLEFNVAVFGSAPLFYQWQKNATNLADGGNVSGSSTRILSLTNASLADAGTYSVMVSNAHGSSNSAGALLTVASSAPYIVLQPTNQTVGPGTNAALVAGALGNFPLMYQWQKNGVNLSDGGNLSGSATSVLTLTNVTQANNGTYRLIVSNSVSWAASSNAVLTVIPASASGTRLATLYSFAGGSDGGTPNALAAGTNGILYGTTEFGGQGGTVFTVNTNGAVATLAAFGPATGFTPLAGLAQGGDGNFYGSTEFGGTNFVGNIFELTPGGALTNLYSFTGGSDGSSPTAALAPGADGDFYGTTATGGDDGAGNVFKMTPGGLLTNLYSFTNGADGSGPVGPLVQGTDGNFYGMTGGGLHGYGNVFKMTPGGLLNSLYSFTSGTDGSAPVGALAQGSDGNFYGATKHNVISGFQFYGTIFRMTPGGTLTTLYALNYTDGAYPFAGLIQGSDGNFYGTTYTGANANNGTVFSITPGGTLTTLAVFDGFDDGAHPETPLVEGADGALYGTTSAGGPGGHGSVFRLSFTGAPQFTSEPASETVVAGTSPQLSATLLGAPPLSYQWQMDTTNITDGNSVSGTMSRVLNFTNVTMANAGTYSLIVSNALNSVISSPAVLTVIPAPAFQSVTLSQGTVTFVLSTVASHVYQLQSAPDVTSGNWTNVHSAFRATGSTATNSDAVITNTQRFYRLEFVR